MKISNKEIAVLNKCPIATSETVGLKSLKKKGTKKVFEESQNYMAQLVFDLHKLLPECKVYIVGLGGCYDVEKGWLAKKKNLTGYYASAILPEFFNKIKELYKKDSVLKNKLHIMKHFSYWSIFTDLSFIESKTDGSKKIKVSSKINLKRLKEKEIDPSELIEVLESLDYKKILLE